MLKNYFITAIRSLRKNTGFSIINILGLSIGLASFMLITLYVYHELTMDGYHEKGDRIFRVVENLRTENELLLQSTSSPPMGPLMAKDFPEVQAFTRFTWNSGLVRKDNMVQFEPYNFLADSSVFEVFSWKLLKGNPKSALKEPNSVVFTESAAKKYFGDQDPIGQLIEVSGDQCKVTGVTADVPENSHFKFDMLTSFTTWSSHQNGNEMRGWFWNGFHTYLLLKDKNQIANVRAKMKDFITRNVEKGGMYYEDLPLQPLKSIYLETPRSWENGKRGSINNIYILSVIALFILLIASFNYVNLATARASRRLKEVGLRKVMGAQRRSLVLQFLGESVIVSSIATLFGFGLAWMVLPPFNDLVDTSLGFAAFPQMYLWGGVVAMAVALGLFSGVYPALMISGFEPLQIFRPSLRSMFSHQNFRKVLVAVQFVISITLVAGTLLVFNQLTLVRNRDLGFQKDATLLIQYDGAKDVREHLESVKTELLKVGGIASVTASHTVPGQQVTNWYSEIEMKDGKMSPTNINTNMVDHDFIPAYGIEMLTGRNFSKESKADDTTAYIVNETAMRDFGWKPEEALGKKVSQGGKNGFIIGVMKDYHYQSLHFKVEPLMINLRPNSFRVLSLKIKSADIPSVVAQVDKKWKELAPALPFRYSFLEQDYDKLYQADNQLSKVASVFSGLAIFVGCLGLLGLTSFSVERRTKEIGIRKVLGASAGHVVFLISKEFMVLIMISFVVAVPVTYYLISKWLTNFTDRISIDALSFVLAGFSVLAIAWLAIGFLSFRAAATNPSETLRVD
ncbi:MAG TPA: ABC transporter permease [Cyclobacteriaceae bacterium]|jgi:putative ABC transport system permease protein|nr:ABC transporter permease [Cyclobacteriaceae bacterium]